jgi:probable LLM family oxidoreductase
LERITFADKMGLDVYGIGEHNAKAMLDSAPVVILAAAAARTSRIRLTSAVTALGTVDPVRLFQEFATLDLISGGRAEIVAGRGASTEAFPLFGLNMRDSAEIFAEKLDLLLKIRDNEFVTWSGKFRSPLNNQAVYPRPVQQQMPVWHAVLRTAQSFIRAGELGMPLMVAIIDGQVDQVTSFVDLYRETGRDAGFDEKRLKVGMHSMGYVAETTEQAIEDFYPGWAQSMTTLHSTPKTRARFDLDISSKGSSLLVGSPEDVANKIVRLSNDFGGITRFCFQMDYAALPHDKLMRSVELIGSKVIPLVQSKIRSATQLTV